MYEIYAENIFGCPFTFMCAHLCALQVFLCALVSRPVCAHTCTQPRGSIGLNPAHFDLDPAHFDLGSAHFDLDPAHFDLGSAHFDLDPAHFDLGSAHFDVDPAHFDLDPAHF